MSSLGIKIEPVYVVDTHALIWYLTNDKKLGKQATIVFAAAERGETRLVISSIVLAEMYYSNRKNHWFPNFNTTFRQLKNKPYFRLVAFKPEHVLDFTDDSTVPEMHDRMITGLARRLNAPLLTSDSQITASNRVTIIW